MKIKRTIEKTLMVEETVGYKCDYCEKIKNGNSFPNDWHCFSSHHQAWGNDSMDSYVYHDVCSTDCYIKTISKAIEKDGDKSDFEVDEMSFGFAEKLVSGFEKKI